MTTPNERPATAGDADVRQRDPRYGLPVVGHGPRHHTTDAARRWRDRVMALPVGAPVDVLLDSGHIVRTSLRLAQRRHREGWRRRADLQVWVAGITGSYADGRIRPADGWWRTRGCVRCSP